MSEAARHDRWQAGDSYDAYMGRWSRKVAPRFLGWLDLPAGLDWLEIGCGTGALSAAILERCAPRSLVSIDSSAGFVEKARKNVADGRVVFRVGDAQALAETTATRDVVASALVLNFIPDKPRALAEMKRVARPGGTVAFYVWDYPGGGLEFLRLFWSAATAVDPAARDLSELTRFPFCTADGLTALARSSGLASVECVPIEVETRFADFEDYWRPFTLGAGPAPGYCVNLGEDARRRLEERLREDFARRAAEPSPMIARAWAVRSRAP